MCLASHPSEAAAAFSGGHGRLQPAQAGSSAGERPSESCGRTGRSMHRLQGRSCPAVLVKPRTAAPKLWSYRLKHFLASKTCFPVPQEIETMGH